MDLPEAIKIVQSNLRTNDEFKAAMTVMLTMSACKILEDETYLPPKKRDEASNKFADAFFILFSEFEISESIDDEDGNWDEDEDEDEDEE